MLSHLTLARLTFWITADFPLTLPLPFSMHHILFFSPILRYLAAPTCLTDAGSDPMHHRKRQSIRLLDRFALNVFAL